MTKVKLKLPSLKSTSKDIAQDLKAIREALNVKPTKGVDKKSKRDHSPNKASNKKVNGVISHSKNSHQYSGEDLGRRSIRQRKPNQRYTDLISETEKPYRKRTISAVSTASSEDYIEIPKKKQIKKPKSSPSPKKKKKSYKKVPKRQLEKPDTETDYDEDDDNDNDNDNIHEQVQNTQQESDDEDEDIDEEGQFVPPPRIREADDEDEEEEDYDYTEASQEQDSDKPKRRKYIKSGKYSRKVQMAGTTSASNARTMAAFEAPPEFDDDEGVSKHHRSPMRPSPMFGSGPTSSTAMTSSARDYMDYDERRQDSPQQQQYMNDALQYGTLSPSHVMHMPASGGIQQNVSINDYSNHGQMTQQSNQNYGQSQYEDPYEEGPALVYGPGPRTITYNGEYYFLSPIPPKRRVSQGPRPRSTRYKPFSANYKPPDVYKYRERLKVLRKKQRLQIPKRRSIDLYGGLGDEERLFSDHQHQRIFRRQMDETDHALEALKSTIGSNDEDEAVLLSAAGNNYISAATPDDYFGTSLGILGGVAEWDRAGSDSGEPRTRGRSRGSGRRGGGSSGGRKRRSIEDWSSRGVYGEDMVSMMDDPYRPTLGASSLTRKRMFKPEGSLLTDEMCNLPNEIAGDHCYIKRPAGLGGLSESEDSVPPTRLAPIATATILDAHPDSYVFASSSSFSFDNQVIETTTVPFDTEASDFDVAC